jgi:Ca-activated chloride channel homolog
VHQKTILVALTIVFLSVCLIWAGEPKSDPIQGEFDLKVDVDTVFLNLSVKDRANNRSLAGLQKNDFVVYEDGVPQEIQQFLPTESPFNLLLLMDVSGSTASYMRMMKQAAVEFIRELNPNDHIAIASFNSRVRLIQGFTNDLEVAEKSIKKLRSGGGTAFYDALTTSITNYMNGLQGRSAIVVFTDGIDNQLDGMPESGSRTTFDELYRKVQEADMMIYTVFLDTEGSGAGGYMGNPGNTSGPPVWPGGQIGGLPRSFPFPQTTPPYPRPRQRSKSDDGDPVIQQAQQQLLMISDHTGGRMYAPKKIAELSGVYSEIADDLRIQYQLGYNPSNQAHDGKWRKIRVELDRELEAIIRTRQGYYARRDSSDSDESSRR